MNLISTKGQDFEKNCGLPNLVKSSSDAELVLGYVKFLKWFCFIFLVLIIFILLFVKPENHIKKSSEKPDQSNNLENSKDVVLVA